MFATTITAAPVPREKPLDPMGKVHFPMYFDNKVFEKADGTPYIENMVIAFRYHDSDEIKKCGFQEGDILRKIGVNKIESDKIDSIVDYIKAIELYRPGAVVEFTVEREGKEVKIKAKMGQGDYKDIEPEAEDIGDPWPG